jgi:hypothetical protein
MEGYCSTGQSPQRAAVPVEEEEEEEERRRRSNVAYSQPKAKASKYVQHNMLHSIRYHNLNKKMSKIILLQSFNSIGSNSFSN